MWWNGITADSCIHLYILVVLNFDVLKIYVYLSIPVTCHYILFFEIGIPIVQCTREDLNHGTLGVSLWTGLLIFIFIQTFLMNLTPGKYRIEEFKVLVTREGFSFVT